MRKTQSTHGLLISVIPFAHTAIVARSLTIGHAFRFYAFSTILMPATRSTGSNTRPTPVVRKRSPTHFQKKNQTPSMETIVPLRPQPTASTTHIPRKQKETTSDVEAERPSKKAKSTVSPNREALPPHSDHPAQESHPGIVRSTLTLFVCSATAADIARHPNKPELLQNLLLRMIFQMSSTGIQIYLGCTPFH